jgi:hypothetical protein
MSDTSLYVWPFLVGVDVTNRAATGVIAAIGNSITDGALSTRDANTRWPNVLAARLLASSEPVKAVVNAGISGGARADLWRWSECIGAFRPRCADDTGPHARHPARGHQRHWSKRHGWRDG